jgi:hypothetical protein
MRAGSFYSSWRQLNALEESLHSEDPALAAMFDRWELCERTAAGEKSPTTARWHLVAALVAAAVAVELIATCALGDSWVIGPIIGAMAIATSAGEIAVARRTRPVRREPRLRPATPLATGAWSRPIGGPR